MTEQPEQRGESLTEPGPQPGHAPEDLPDYGLTTDAGNRTLQGLVVDVSAGVEGGELDRTEALVQLSDGLRRLSADHPEAHDVTVRDAVVRELDPVFEHAGFEKLTPFEF